MSVPRFSNVRNLAAFIPTNKWANNYGTFRSLGMDFNANIFVKPLEIANELDFLGYP